MLDKFIFLDVDGVLNCHHMVEVQTTVFELDERFLNNLEKIVKETNAKIILSSSWHTYFDENENNQVKITVYDDGKLSKGGTALTTALDNHGLKIHRLVTKEKYPKKNRSELIEEFLQGNPCSRYILIDDENHKFTKEQKKVWIKTTYTHKLGYEYEGLTETHTNKAIKLLNK